MDPLATVAELGVWLDEDLTGSDHAAAALDHASSLVRVAAGQTWQTTAPPDGIGQLVVRVAARMFTNPSGVSYATAGPYSGSFAGIELTNAERSEIHQILHPGGRRGLGTISTTRGPFETPGVYVDVAGSDKPLPARLPS